MDILTKPLLNDFDCLIEKESPHKTGHDIKQLCITKQTIKT